MLSNLKVLAFIAVLTVALSAIGVWRMALIREGEWREKARRADSTLVVLRKEQQKIDTVYATTTKRVTAWRDSVITLHDTVLTRLTDTVLVKQYIAKTDSAAKACTDLQSICELSRKNLLLQVATMQSKINAFQVRSCTGIGITWSVLGAVAGGFAVRQAGK